MPSSPCVIKRDTLNPVTGGLMVEAIQRNTTYYLSSGLMDETI